MRALLHLSMVAILLVAGVGCNDKGSTKDSSEEQMTLFLQRQVSAANLARTIQDLENFETRYSWEKQEAVADYLIKRLDNYGLQFSIDEYTHNQKIWRNVMATLPGQKHPERIYLIIAHYDSTSKQAEMAAPGADDNGTGTAAAIEIARILGEISLHATVKIVFFSNEEQGLLGSKHFAKKSRSENQDIRGTLNLDVIGYNNPIGSLVDDAEKEASIIYRIKQQAKRLRNYAFSKLYPYGRVTVAGRPPNRELVHRTAEALREFTRLNVVATIDEDCG